jgi:HTH-type transcriptional regulator/antitoxin HigA
MCPAFEAPTIMTTNAFPLEPVMHSDLAVHPGELLGVELAERSLSQRELAALMHRPATMVGDLVAGRLGITARSALELEAALGIPATLWMRLQDEYELVR